MGFAENVNRMLQSSRGGIGQWVVLRHFSEVKSQYWNERTQEAVGGPPYEYTDTIVLAAKQMAFMAGRPPVRAGVHPAENVVDLQENFRYFLPPDVTIKEDDEIYDLNIHGVKPTTIDYTESGVGTKITGRFKVKLVIPYRDADQGKNQYTVVFTKRYTGE